MKKPLIILLLVELVFAIAFGQLSHLDRAATARAWIQWHQHPTAETRGTFGQQKAISYLECWAFSGILFTVLAGATLFTCWYKRGKPKTM